MIVSGGIGPNAWQVSNYDETNKAGRVIRRTVHIDIRPTHTLNAQDALRLATAIRLVAKNGATH
jgi:hypothetical protein